MKWMMKRGVVYLVANLTTIDAQANVTLLNPSAQLDANESVARLNAMGIENVCEDALKKYRVLTTHANSSHANYTAIANFNMD